MASADYRLSKVVLGGDYTLSYSTGNNDGEDANAGPAMAPINQYPDTARRAGTRRPVSWGTTSDTSCAGGAPSRSP